MTQKSTIATQITTLTEIIQAQALDESTRLEALNAARGLLATLESPTERIIQDVVMVSRQTLKSLKAQRRLCVCAGFPVI